MSGKTGNVASINLQSLYSQRFSGEGVKRNAVWKILCEDYFQKWVAPQATVVEIAAGYCQFINHIAAGRKIAVDLNPDVASFAAPDVEVLVSSASELGQVEEDSIDVAFVSNFFEHITREQILAVLQEIHRVLRPTGRLLVLQPNIRFCAKDYWMFFDHVTALDDRSLAEALGMAGFTIDLCIPRFLPYTMKSRLPHSDRLIRMYLRAPLAWRFLGAQAFVVASLHD